MKSALTLAVFGVGFFICSAALACSVDPDVLQRSELPKVLSSEIVQSKIQALGGKIEFIKIHPSSYWIGVNGCAFQAAATYKSVPTPYGSVASCPILSGVEILTVVCP